MMQISHQTWPAVWSVAWPGRTSFLEKEDMDFCQHLIKLRLLD